MPPSPRERDYVLGTHDEEIVRLGIQHRVWRPRSLDAWRRAGFTVGQTIVDVGCGPGYATLDLADIVGVAGKVVAIDRSRRFLDVVESTRDRLGLDNVETYERELDGISAPLPVTGADGAWCRWVLCFLKQPRALLERIAAALRPGGTLVIHDYFDYATWRLAPPCAELEEFVSVVMKSWRASGGEPDIALQLPRWLEELGFRIQSLTSIIDIVPPSSFVWQWPKSFVESGTSRFVERGELAPERAEAIVDAYLAAERAPHTRLITPGLMEVIAVR
jgi:SAM-dependent methyltransferase